MEVEEKLAKLKQLAQQDEALRKSLLDTRQEKNPIGSFCRISTACGIPLYDMDLITAGEEAYALMKRSTNGGGENSPRLQYQDDYYALFLAELSGMDAVKEGAS